jgi:hypothetical protein
MGRKTGTKVPELRLFKENVKRVHIPTAICKSALESELSDLDPAKYGGNMTNALAAWPL